MFRWESNRSQIAKNVLEYVRLGIRTAGVLSIGVMNLWDPSKTVFLDVLSDCEFSGTLLSGVSVRP